MESIRRRGSKFEEFEETDVKTLLLEFFSVILITKTFNPHCATDQNFTAATLQDMACTCISSSLFTPLQPRHRPHFPAATFHSCPSIHLTPSHPFCLYALPLFTGNNNNNGGDGGFWGNNPFNSDDDFSSSSSRYPYTFSLPYILFLQPPSNRIRYLTEPVFAAASYSENTEEESSSLPAEITIGIDIGMWPCCISVWNDSEVGLQKKINETMKISCETSKNHEASSTEVSLSLENEITILYMKPFCSIIFGENASFPFLMHTVDIKVRPFAAAFVNKLWKSTTAGELLGKFMIELRYMVETHLNRPIRNVVFTVPVSFSRLQLNWIRCACAMADLKVIRLMPKPTAVALWYMVHQLNSSAFDNESMKIALIFNMDAGYCDVSVIEAEKGKFRIKAMTGSTIGGEDLLGNMMCYLLPDFEEIFKRHVHWNSEIISMAFLRSRIHDVITKLSSKTSVEVDLDLGYGLKICKVVTRKEFEEVNKEVFEKCEKLIIQCLQDAKIEVENINDVIIVGGCCNIPRVKNLVTEICNGKEIYKGMNPLNAVLCGAAVAGSVDDDAIGKVMISKI
ncbi:hypothetical protein P8452_68651 [Trifolium repens]|nr:hypothetical protein P8452_68651 [Trifolium repens]